MQSLYRECGERLPLLVFSIFLVILATLAIYVFSIEFQTRVLGLDAVLWPVQDAHVFLSCVYTAIWPGFLRGGG